MRKVIDLTLPIRRTWRYDLEENLVKDFAKGDVVQITEFTLRSHWHTHIDSPKHFDPNGKTLDDYPLDMLAGTALILDLTHIGANTAVTAEILEEAAKGKTHRDILLLRTDWGKSVSWETKQFWDDAPYVDESGAKWLRDYKPDVIGFDFPQDHDIRYLATRDPKECEHTCHDYILKNGILMIEYMTNLWEIPTSECEIVGLPLKLENADGAPIRIVALP